MYLSDDFLDLQQWQIPAGVIIGADSYLVFLADDDGTQGPLHTNYQLSRTGEQIALVDVDGETIHRFDPIWRTARRRLFRTLAERKRIVRSHGNADARCGQQRSRAVGMGTQ